MSTPAGACLLFVVALAAQDCGGRTLRTTPAPSGPVDVAQLWTEPADLETRDLLIGPAAGAPTPAAAHFTFLKGDPTGFSPGYHLRDQNGVEWSVKLGPEAQTEVVASRILWAIGFHQVPAYYVTDWTMDGGPGGHPGPGRFRPDVPNMKAVGEWSWSENPFTHTRPFKGLVVANLIINNWDWKTSNNRIYDVVNPDGSRERWYVVRDLGASFGKSDATPLARVLGERVAQGSRNNLEDFEQQGFIEGVAGGQVQFDYGGIHEHITERITVDDVVWTCRLLERLSDDQWRAAFTAGGYPPDRAARFIAKLKSKIAEGLALRSTL